MISYSVKVSFGFYRHFMGREQAFAFAAESIADGSSAYAFISEHNSRTGDSKLIAELFHQSIRIE